MVVTGEPGMGKTCLVEALAADVGDDGDRLHLEGLVQDRNTPFAPAVALLRNLLAGYEAAGVAPSLTAIGRATGLADSISIHALAALIGLSMGDDAPLVLRTADSLRRAQIDAIVDWVAAPTTRPRLLSIDDAQWLDPTTSEVVERIVARSPELPMLVVMTARSGDVPSWADRASIAAMALAPLDDDEVAVLVRAVAGDDAGPGAVGAIVARSAGIPLFAEELARAVRQEEAEDSRDHIPVTLQDLLTARLHRLGEAREVAQLASVVGMVVDRRLLLALTERDEQDFDVAVEELAAAGLLQVDGAGEQTTYRFRHALLRDTAYQSLLRSQRKALHREVAEVLTTTLAGLASERPELVAAHWTSAEVPAEAIASWCEAAARAESVSAYREALTHADHALDLIDDLDEDGRLLAELKVQQVRQRLLSWVSGFTAADHLEAMARVREVAERLGQDPTNYADFDKLWGITLSQGNIVASEGLACEWYGCPPPAPTPIGSCGRRTRWRARSSTWVGSRRRCSRRSRCGMRAESGPSCSSGRPPGPR